MTHSAYIHKVGAKVILNYSDYLNEALRQLSDEETYVCLPSDPTQGYREHLDLIVREAVSIAILDHTGTKRFVPSHPVAPIFHHLPKTHKADVSLQDRLIVVSICSLGEPCGDLMDTLLQPLVNRIPSHLRDTEHSIQVFEGFPWSENKKWLTCDARSLDFSIP